MYISLFFPTASTLSFYLHHRHAHKIVEDLLFHPFYRKCFNVFEAKKVTTGHVSVHELHV